MKRFMPKLLCCLTPLGFLILFDMYSLHLSVVNSILIGILCAVYWMSGAIYLSLEIRDKK
jgi:hypothetical protein